MLVVLIAVLAALAGPLIGLVVLGDAGAVAGAVLSAVVGGTLAWLAHQRQAALRSEIERLKHPTTRDREEKMLQEDRIRAIRDK